MSGRDPSLTGFGDHLTSQWYHGIDKHEQKYALSRDLINCFLSLCVGMKIDRVEFFNSVDIIERVKQSCGLEDIDHTIEPLFFAAVRLSVFWRRRRDVLSMQNLQVRKSLEAVNCGTASILEAEGDILAALGCHVWRSRCNAVELCHSILIKAFCRQVNEEDMRNLIDVAADTCFILLCEPKSSTKTFLEMAYVASIVSVVVCTQMMNYEDIVASIGEDSLLDTKQLLLDTKVFTGKLLN